MNLLREGRIEVVVHNRYLLHPQLVLDQQNYEAFAVDQINRPESGCGRRVLSLLREEAGGDQVAGRTGRALPAADESVAVSPGRGSLAHVFKVGH